MSTPQLLCTFNACGFNADTIVRIHYPQSGTRPAFWWGAPRCYAHRKFEQRHAEAVGAEVTVTPVENERAEVAR